MFPTDEQPDNKYKFVSLNFQQGKDLRVVNRSYFSLLEWLGDWGGLLDALFLLAEFLIAPFSAFALKVKVAESLVSVKDKKYDNSATAFSSNRHNDPFNKSSTEANESKTTANIYGKIMKTKQV